MNSHSLLTRLLAACLLAAALSAVAAARANAAPYVVVGCSDLDGASARPASGWYLAAGMWPSRNDCAQRGGLYAANGDRPNLFRFDAPPGTTISRLVTTFRAHLSGASSSAMPVLVAEAGHSGTWEYIRPARAYLGARPVDWDGKRVTGDAHHATALRLGVRCERGGPCTSGGQPWARFYALAVVLDDSLPPTVGVSAAARASGTVPVAITARDSGGGLYYRALELDGRRVRGDFLCTTIRGSLAGLRHVTRGVPCPLDGTATVSLDTRAFEDGEHLLTARTEDIAGNGRGASTRIVIDNRPPRAGTVTLTGDPAEALTAQPAGFAGEDVAYEYRWERCAEDCAEIGGATGRTYRPRTRDAGRRLRAVVSASDGGGTVRAASALSEVVPAPASDAQPASRLTAWLERGHRRVRRATVTWPVTVRVRGRLTDAGGRPLAREPVRMLERIAGRGWRRVAGMRTDREGRLTATTRVGPSRQLRLVHRGAAVTLRLNVRAAVSVRLRRRGALTLLSGRVRGGHVPAAGLRVHLQSRNLTGWRTGAVLRTDGLGRFSATGQAPRGARLRVVVPPRRGYPFARGVGRP